MSDVRKCDGPECKHEAPLDTGVARKFEEEYAEHYLTLEGASSLGRKVHFHNKECLVKWTERNK